MSTDSAAGGTRVRASDAEREEYARVVREAVGEGRLSLDEGDERLAKIYASRYRDELRPLVTDLPREEGWSPRGWRGGRPSSGPHSGPHSGPQPGPGRGPCHPGPPWGWGRRRSLGRHLWFVLTVSALLTTIWLATGAHFFWPLIPIVFLAMGLVRHVSWRRWSRATPEERPQ